MNWWQVYDRPVSLDSFFIQFTIASRANSNSRSERLLRTSGGFGRSDTKSLSDGGLPEPAQAAQVREPAPEHFGHGFNPLRPVPAQGRHGMTPFE